MKQKPSNKKEITTKNSKTAAKKTLNNGNYRKEQENSPDILAEPFAVDYSRRVEFIVHKGAILFEAARKPESLMTSYDKFDMNLSEKIVSVADIYSYGYEVFEDESKFNAWIFRSNRSLGGQAPYDLLDNQYGREEVKNLIGRIDYGVYS
jgi:uncharacterized protein (DUF2384 family)